MPGVKPARYLARFHWVTIVKVPQFPAAYLACGKMVLPPTAKDLMVKYSSCGAARRGWA